MYIYNRLYLIVIALSDTTANHPHTATKGNKHDGLTSTADLLDMGSTSNSESSSTAAVAVTSDEFPLSQGNLLVYEGSPVILNALSPQNPKVRLYY